ncbi:MULTISPECIES: queuosine precursor transporter [unclassified Paenibacillus]|uniref:queuosine precursor transporter n=1 Tax=unclassified Paenibacillus TaxID=185978 RepID=UPI002405430F|nr:MULTISPECIES: queuosine precursor transporter [unclassified Paenibacillus]MDF9845268.1 putative integral membrane protein (TIGR00697 family) [Paenibacillus sp. PastF-2]MDF9851850.1 putative integral membrane protein (TIGR00697 family) [Paenibacillus sp. PastM-2]MDF9858435.1 putative integral membrane protein (TIGR00697 family) [Paenibacillus sp. PastF-1]MDH6483701.1 putative integral membrane protein (TIGR00697 family) [Paenibacillus sp. PastH-2]MDH6511084.1 putative integral membrane prote
MFNLLWGILFVIVNFAFFLICYRLFGKKGLYAWVGVATVIANIQVAKTIEMPLGIVMTLGNTMYVTLYMTSDLLNEKYGRAEARNAVWFGFFTLLMTTAIMQMVLVFEPQETDIAQSSLETIFGMMPRLALGSLTAYFISQFLDVRLYSWIRKYYGSSRQLWIRSNGSTMVSSFVDTLIFCTIAFAGLYDLKVWTEILLTTYLSKFLLTGAGTPILYIARSFSFAEETGSRKDTGARLDA